MDLECVRDWLCGRLHSPPRQSIREIAMLVDTVSDRIRQGAERVLSDDELYKSMATAPSPYGDGDTETRILEVLFSSRKSALGLPAHTRCPL